MYTKAIRLFVDCGPHDAGMLTVLSECEITAVSIAVKSLSSYRNGQCM